jgi:magnesium-transporting ATPase (P-type)
MVLIGLVGFLDPPKKDVKDTLKIILNIGIKTKILTGDNYMLLKIFVISWFKC